MSNTTNTRELGKMLHKSIRLNIAELCLCFLNTPADLCAMLSTCSISPHLPFGAHWNVLHYFSSPGFELVTFSSNCNQELTLLFQEEKKKKSRSLVQVTPLVHTVKARLDLNKVKQTNTFFLVIENSWAQDVKPQFHILFLSSSKSLSHNTRVFNWCDADTLSERSIHTSCS